MNRSVYTTEGLPGDEQFGYWRDVVWQAFTPVALTRAPGEDERAPFSGTVRTTRLGGLQLAEIHSGTQHVLRTATLTRRRPDDGFFLNLPLCDGTSATQDARSAALRPGDFAVVDAARPFHLHFPTSFRQLSLHVPAELLAPAVTDAERATAIRVDGSRGAGAAVSAAIRALPEAAGHMARAEAAAFGSWLAGAIALAVGAAVPAAAAQHGPRMHWHAACGHIDRRLHDPALAPAEVAAAVGISVRYLHRLFADRGATFGSYLLGLRLARCKEALADPRNASETVAAVAARHGLPDASYFARVFKARYGCPPRMVRPG